MNDYLSVSIYAFIPFLALLQGLLFALLLLLRGKREERYSDYWLSFVLLFSGLNGVPYMLGWLGIDFLWEHFTYLPWDGFWLLTPPATYFFLKSLTNDSWRFTFKKDALHFWAYGLYFVEHGIVGTIGLYNKDLLHQWSNSPFVSFSSTAISWGIEFYYFVLSYRLYKHFSEWTVNEFSDPERVRYKWFRNYLIVKIIITLITIANSVYVALSPEHGNSYYALMWIGYLMDGVLIYYLSISGYTQSRVRSIKFVENPVENSISTLPTVDTEGGFDIKTEDVKIKNTLTSEDVELWKTKILSHFSINKPYLNPDLTLSELAENLKTNTSILSQVINTGFSKNFNDFVNEYRVNDFRDKISTPQYQHLTLLAIAFECGFNSKSTFNRAVKKITNQMPSELMKEFGR